MKVRSWGRLEVGGYRPYMKGRKKRNKKILEEQVVQKFPYRCPYCDQIVSYEKDDLKLGENEIECPSCKKKYIKVDSDSSPPSFPSPIECEGKN